MSSNGDAFSLFMYCVCKRPRLFYYIYCVCMSPCVPHSVSCVSGPPNTISLGAIGGPMSSNGDAFSETLSAGGRSAYSGASSPMY